MPNTRSIFVLGLTLGGMIGWAVLFTVLYGGASLICAPPVSMDAMSVFRFAAGAIAAASLFVLVAGAVLLRRHKTIGTFHSPSSLQTFMIDSARALAIAGLIAAIWLAIPVLIFSDCRS